MKKLCLLIFVFFMAVTWLETQAATITSTGTGGNWSSAGTWDVGVPNTGDDVIIADGTTVTIDVSPNTLASITVGQGASGILTFDGVAIRAVVVTGNITVAAGGTFSVQATGTFTNTLSIGGDLTNNGTFDMSLGTTTTICTVTFNKAGIQNISGTPVLTRFRSIVLDKGSVSNKVSCSSNVTDNGASPGAITFTNGTWEQTANTFTVGSGSQTIGANGAWVFSNSGSLNMAVNASIVVTGTLTVNTSGTFSLGAGANGLSTVGTPTINFTAGTINIYGKLTLTLGTTTINGANINIYAQGTSPLTTGSNTFECSGGNLTFSSGSVTIVDPNAASDATKTGNDLKITSAGTVNLTGSTFYLGDGVSTKPATAVGTGWYISLSNNPVFYNLVIRGGNITGRDVLLKSNTVVSNSLTLTSGTVNLNGKTLTLNNGATISCSGGSLSGAPTFVTSVNVNYTQNGSQITTGPELPTSTTILNNLTINSSNGVLLSAPVKANGVLTLTSGNISLGNNNLTATNAITGGSASSYVVTNGTGGLIRSVVSGTVFPVGDIAYRPVTFSSVTGSPVISVMVTNANAGGSSDGTLGSLSPTRYWSIGLVSGTFSGGKVNLTYGADDGVTDNANLNIGKSTTSTLAGFYTSLGGSGSANTSGNITSNFIGPLLNPSYFLLANNSSGTNPLPVELSSFTPTMNGRNVQLNWETKTEVKLNKFEIDRALVSANDASVTWASVGSVPASGTSNSPRKYSYTEKDLQSGKYQYRLKMIDNDGSYKFSNIVETDITSPKNFELSQNYPNPFNPSTRINYSIPFDSRVTLEVYNIIGERMGQIVNEEQSAGYYTVNFSSSNLNKSITSGVYIYKINAVDKSTGNVFTSIKKMMLLK